jgi:hypothetical protein
MQLLQSHKNKSKLQHILLQHDIVAVKKIHVSETFAQVISA